MKELKTSILRVRNFFRKASGVEFLSKKVTERPKKTGRLLYEGIEKHGVFKFWIGRTKRALAKSDQIDLRFGD